MLTFKLEMWTDKTTKCQEKEKISCALVSLLQIYIIATCTCGNECKNELFVLFYLQGAQKLTPTSILCVVHCKSDIKYHLYRYKSLHHVSLLYNYIGEVSE